MSVRSSVHSSLNGGSTKTKPKRKDIEQDRKHKNNPSEFKIRNHYDELNFADTNPARNSGIPVTCILGLLDFTTFPKY